MASRARAAKSEDAAAELLARVARGSEEAFTELYRRFESRIFAFCMSRLNDPAVAADVLSEVMLEAWRQAERFEGRSKVSTWLFSIARYKVLDEMRRRGRRPEEELDPALPDEGRASAVDALAGAEREDEVRRCLQNLSDAHREAVHLAFFEDLSYAEIARIVERPEGTVKTRVFHAKQALKRCLAQLGVTR